MAAKVNLDALIPREDFLVEAKGTPRPLRQTIEIRDLEDGAWVYPALRKPDFQRETSEWDANRVVGLIRSFLEGDLVPAVILWQNQELQFVIDGSHRLSALIAWVHDDYGDGLKSQAFFNNMIPAEQLAVAKRTRTMVEKSFGSYESHQKAVKNPEQYGPDIVRQGLLLASLSLNVQWVSGDATKAEDSFIRINQQSAIISPQEMELLRTRREPATIAARAIIRRGTGHRYWASFSEERQARIEELAAEIHQLLFEPVQKSPLRSIDLAPGGPEYSATALRMVFDFISQSVGVRSLEDDTDGQRTVDYLTRTRKVMQLLLSNHPSSLGLHPAVYFYSWTGKQQPILFLTMASLAVEWERRGRLKDFIAIRASFEEFLIANRALVNQIVRKFGSKASGMSHLASFYLRVLELLASDADQRSIIESLQHEPAFSYLQPNEVATLGSTPSEYSSQVKSGLALKELLDNALRCKICQGLLPFQALSFDHIQRKQDGGVATVKNQQLTHPYCNTGVKESSRGLVT
jgi:hypothetical protein